MSLIIKNLKVSIEGKEILKGVSLEIRPGEVVAIMGPNGSGKSTLAYTMMGHPNYEVIKNSRTQELKTEMSIDGVDVLGKTPDERARMGMFLATQYPVSVPGVTVREVLLAALRARPLPGLPLGKGEERRGSISALELKKKVEMIAGELKLSPDLLKRGINEGFSGGEKKKMEILQMRILNPKYAVLDETDSGLDIDALKIVAEGAVTMAKEGAGVLVITHYKRLLSFLKPNRVMVLKNGLFVDQGGEELIDKLEKEGYKKYE